MAPANNKLNDTIDFTKMRNHQYLPCQNKL
jgi:hypothetical protein